MERFPNGEDPYPIRKKVVRVIVDLGNTYKFLSSKSLKARLDEKEQN